MEMLRAEFIQLPTLIPISVPDWVNREEASSAGWDQVWRLVFPITSGFVLEEDGEQREKKRISLSL
jgi:hypothetical protein